MFRHLLYDAIFKKTRLGFKLCQREYSLYTFAQFRSHFEYLNTPLHSSAAILNILNRWSKSRATERQCPCKCIGKVDAQKQNSCRNVPFVMRKFLISVPVSVMIGKQGKNFTTAKIFKNVCKTLFVTVTILSPNFLLNNCCIKIMVDTCHIYMENVHMTKVIFLHHVCD